MICLAMCGGLLSLGASATAQSAAIGECSEQDVREALAGDYAGPPCRFTTMPDSVESPARHEPLQLAGAREARRQARVGYRAADPRQSSGLSPARHQRVVPIAARADGGEESLRLSDSFFSGSLVGGVGRAPSVGYGYRGLIVIDASGHTNLLMPGQVSASPVRRMQERATLRTQLVGQ